MFRKMIAVVSVVLLFPLFCILDCHAQEESLEPLIRDLICYYQYYQDEAKEEMEDLLTQIEEIDPVQADKLRRIVEQWSRINREMELNTGAVPADLPGDESLCFVVMGYDLKDDGSMKKELLTRLDLALQCAEEYPEAYLLCTGGASSKQEGYTEAGEMKKWLVDAGVSEDRIITETKAKNTTQNARKTYALLKKKYPQVKSVVLVSSDYHLRRSMLAFSAVAVWQEQQPGQTPYELVSNAACITEKTVENELLSQAKTVAAVVGVSIADADMPRLYQQDVTVETSVSETEEMQYRDDIAAAKNGQKDVIPAFALIALPALLLLTLVLLGVLLVVILKPKKRR